MNEKGQINRGGSSTRSHKAQMSIDFLIGMTLFAGVFFFVFQFTTSAIAPFVSSSDEVPTKVQKAADNIYFDEIGGDEKGELNLTYLEDNKDDIEQIQDDLAVDDDRYGMNITVTELGDDNPELSAGDSPPDAGVSISRTTRFGVVADDGGSSLDVGDKVLIEVKLW